MLLKQRLLLAVFALFASNAATAQEMKIDLENKTVYVQLEVSKEKIILDSLPDILYLVFPDKSPEKTKLGFNDAKATYKKDDKEINAHFTLGFQNTDSTGINIQMSDIRFGMVKLNFKDNQLTAVNDRLLKEPKRIVLDAKNKPIIQFNTKKEEEKETKPADSWTKPKDPQVMIVVDSTIVATQLMSWSKISSNSVKHDDNSDKPLEFPYNQRYSSPSANSKNSNNAVTHEYEILLDERPGSSRPITYMRLKNSDGIEHYKVKKRINPSVQREIVVHVIGHADSIYSVEDSETNHFMQYADKIEGLFIPDDSTVKDDDSTTEPQESVDSTSKSIQPDISRFLSFVENYDDAVTKIKKIDIFMELTDAEVSFKLKNDLTASSAFIEKLDSLHAEAKKIQELLLKRITADSLIIDSLKKDIVKFQLKIKSYIENEYDSIARYQKASLSIIYHKLTALNEKIHNHQTTEPTILNELQNISAFMMKHLYVAMSSDAETLEKRLRQSVEQEITDKYYNDFKSVISQIRTEYDAVNNRKNKYRHYTKQISIPNADAMEIAVKTKSGPSIFERELRTSLGFKIDFSSGFIYSGLNRPDFVIDNETMRYKETRDSVASDGSMITTYTGRILDTTGQVIRSNPKRGFNAGFLVHAYTRSGTSTNLALTTGIIVNNSDLQYLIGGSILLAAGGDHRIALSGGLVFGKEKMLSSELRQFERNPEENSIQANRYDLKPYYTGTANLANSTYEKYNTSFFFAVTLNLGTLNIK